MSIQPAYPKEQIPMQNATPQLALARVVKPEYSGLPKEAGRRDESFAFRNLGSYKQLDEKKKKILVREWPGIESETSRRQNLNCKCVWRSLEGFISGHTASMIATQPV